MDPRVAPVQFSDDDAAPRDTPIALDPKGLRVVVCGLGAAGWSAADVLAQREAKVLAVDNGDNDAVRERAQLLGMLGGQSRVGSDAPTDLPLVDGEPADLVVTSPGWPPSNPLLREAARQGIPVWSDVELAWRLRTDGAPPWIMVTGTNGKTTTVHLIAAMIAAAGKQVMTVGNVGLPAIDAVVAPQAPDLVVVEVSSFQLERTFSVAPIASTCLNIAPDHLDWHGGLEGYTRAKGRVYENTSVACIYNVADKATEALVEGADVVEGARAIGFTTGTPAPSMLGVVEDSLCDRAFIEDRKTTARQLATLDDVAATFGVAAPHHVANTLAAAACVLAAGLPPAAIADGLRSFNPEPHRATMVGTFEDVQWIDDSKATNAHAADASLRSAADIVWIAGGLAKGARFEDLVGAHAERIRAVVLIGLDKEPLREALAAKVPQVPVTEIDSADTAGLTAADKQAVGEDVMVRAVEQAARYAEPGWTVLFAPACASMDQFVNYVSRGEAFSRTVRDHYGK